MAFIVGQVILEMALPNRISEVSNLVSKDVDAQEVFDQGLSMLLYVFGSMVFAGIAGFMVAKVSSGFSERVRGDFFSKTMGFSVGEVGKFSSSSLITRCTADILMLQTFFQRVSRP